MNNCDLYIDNLKQIVTVKGFSQRPAIGSEQSRLSIIQDGAIAIQGQKIIAVGPKEKLARVGLRENAARYLDGKGMIALPGFIDPHTHLVFAGSREEEFIARLKGEDYLKILKKGGGILSTVRATRAISKKELLAKTAKWAERLLTMGTTTCEVKSGYGLDRETELKELQVIKHLEEEGSLELIPTYLGAHAWPEEYRDHHQDYLKLIIDEILPEIVIKKLAEFCDVFCEKGVFSYEESRIVLEAARKLGLGLKIHADELNNLRGAELAAELKATSADHLVQASPEGIKAMAKNGVIAVLLPATTFILQKKNYAPAREMIDNGVAVALATDFNPGTSPVGSIPITVALACMKLGMTIEEAITAVTINAAHAIGKAQKIGSIELGKQADILLLEQDNYRQLSYYFGFNLVKIVIKKGKIVIHAFEKS